MRYIVVGGGSVGGLIAARLHASGKKVALVARGAAGTAAAKDGFRLMTCDGATTHRLAVHSSVHEAGIEAGDAVILAVKSQDTLGAVQDLAACAPRDVHVFCAQNGLENERIALRLFPNVYGMFVFVFAASLTPGHARCYTFPSFGVLDLGSFPRGSNAIADHVAGDLRDSGFDSRAVDDIVTWKAGKLIANLGNALTACYGDSSKVPDLLEAAQAEGRACLQAAGVPFVSLDEMLARRLHLLPLRTVEGQAFPGSSSWQSLARGTGVTEVDFLTGEIVLKGRLHGVAAPVNEALQLQVRRMARDRVPPGSLDPSILRREMGMSAPG